MVEKALFQFADFSKIFDFIRPINGVFEFSVQKTFDFGAQCRIDFEKQHFRFLFSGIFDYFRLEIYQTVYFFLSQTKGMNNIFFFGIAAAELHHIYFSFRTGDESVKGCVFRNFA